MESTVPTPQVTPASVGLRYGLLLGIISVLLSFVMLTMQWQENWGMRLLSLAISIGGLVLAQRDFKQRNSGFMSFGEGVVVSLVVTAVSGVLGALFMYVYLTISPDVVTQMLDKAREGMEARGSLTDEQIDQGMAFTKKFMTPVFMAGSGLLGSVIGGLIIGMIVAAFVKHTKPEFE